MYDAGKIIGGLIIFLVLITSPFWYNMSSGKAGELPHPKIITSEKQCVMPTAYMRSDHMDLLNQWRHAVVRNDDRIHVSHENRKFNKSLTGTCLDCHSNKKDFCDECHNYSAVDEPDCWNCHVITEEVQ